MTITSTSFEQFFNAAPKHIQQIVDGLMLCDGMDSSIFEQKAIAIADEKIRLHDAWWCDSCKKEWLKNEKILVLRDIPMLSIGLSKYMLENLLEEADAFELDVLEVIDQQDVYFSKLFESEIPEITSDLKYNKKYRNFWTELTLYSIYVACVYYRDIKQELGLKTPYEELDELLYSN